MLAIHENARVLVDDARLLLEADRIPRAYALAELAAEELGKLIMVSRTAIDVALGHPVDWARFRKRFQDHNPKAANIALLDHILDGYIEAWRSGDAEAIRAGEGFAQAEQNAAVMPQAKNRALYVDYRAGRVLVPEASIPRAWAEKMVVGVAQRVKDVKEKGLPPRKGWLEEMAADPGMRQRAEELRKRAKAADEPQPRPAEL